MSLSNFAQGHTCSSWWGRHWSQWTDSKHCALCRSPPCLPSSTSVFSIGVTVSFTNLPTPASAKPCLCVRLMLGAGVVETTKTRFLASASSLPSRRHQQIRMKPRMMHNCESQGPSECPGHCESLQGWGPWGRRPRECGEHLVYNQHGV